MLQLGTARWVVWWSCCEKSKKGLLFCSDVRQCEKLEGDGFASDKTQPWVCDSVVINNMGGVYDDEY